MCSILSATPTGQGSIKRSMQLSKAYAIFRADTHNCAWQQPAGPSFWIGLLQSNFRACDKRHSKTISSISAEQDYAAFMNP